MRYRGAQRARRRRVGAAFRAAWRMSSPAAVVGLLPERSFRFAFATTSFSGIVTSRSMRGEMRSAVHAVRQPTYRARPRRLRARPGARTAPHRAAPLDRAAYMEISPGRADLPERAHLPRMSARRTQRVRALRARELRRALAARCARRP